MGLFDRLKKQDCEICGKEVGMFGYKKLEDGEICKECVRKLSPWFEERRHSTVDQIKEQLAYRERNAQQLHDFRVSRVIGERYKMYVEDINGVPNRFFVTSDSDYMDANPDIISFKDVLSCSTDIDSRDEEIKRKDSNGNMVSYNPPRYDVHYNFYIEMNIGNNPYFDDIRFQVNSHVVTIESSGVRGGFGGPRFGAGIGDARDRQRYYDYERMCQEIEQTVRDSKMVAAAVAAAQLAATMTPPAPAAAPAPAPAAHARPKFCQNCGAPAEGGKFCQSCGSPL